MLNNCQVVHHHDNCLNTKKAFASSCRLCIDACPHQAISEYRELDAKRCTECGACMAVCPSDGFVDRNSDKLYEYIRNAEKVSLNCPQAIPVGYEIPCLGIIDRDLWMALMLQAREKEVEIYTGGCVTCPDKKACGISVRVLKEVHASWPGHPPVAIKVTPDDGSSHPSPNTQSKAQSTIGKIGWRNMGREKIEEMLPGITSGETYQISRTRQFLAESWKAREELLPLPALTVGKGCTNCGVCAAICPQGALTKKEVDAQLSLIYEPLKCARCQRCVSICRPNALSLENKFLSHRLLTGKILLHQGEPRYCSRCGKQVFDNSEPALCIACASSDPDERLFFL